MCLYTLFAFIEIQEKLLLEENASLSLKVKIPTLFNFPLKNKTMHIYIKYINEYTLDACD